MFGRFKLWWEELRRRQHACRNLGPTSIAIDCGANVGKVTGWLASKGATVYAFEPNPHAFAALRKKFATMPRVHCIPKAVHAHSGTMKLFLHQNATENQILWSTGSSLLASKSNVDKESSLEIETVDLAEFILSLEQKISLVKIDVEGVECEILNNIIDRGVHKVVGRFLVETHERIPEVRSAVEQLRARISRENIDNIDLSWI